MYNKNYYLYVTPINGEENSIDRQLQSGRAFRNSNIPCDYRQVVTENTRRKWTSLSLIVWVSTAFHFVSAMVQIEIYL